jgi:hypothetical protein
VATRCRIRSLGLVSSAALASMTPGCIDVKVPDKFEHNIKTPDLPAATKNIDPLGMKRLLDQIEGLRADNEKLHGELILARAISPKGLSGLLGTWYLEGDRNRPCYIRQTGDSGRLLLIDQDGMKGNGDPDQGGTRLRVDGGWRPGSEERFGAVFGGNTIIWDNKDVWRR